MRKRLCTVGVLAAVTAVVSSSVAYSAADQPAVGDRAATITVAPDDGSPLSSSVTGWNMTAMWQASGAYDPEAGQVDQSLIDNVSNAGISTLRFPAGTGGNQYQWKEGLKPVDERSCWYAFPYKGEGEPNNPAKSSTMEYGILEHLEFIQQVGAETTVVLNFSNGTVEDAQDLVEFLNQPNDGSNPRGGVDYAAKRAELFPDHPEPFDVEWFEVGNEMGHAGQAYWTDSSASVEQRAEYYANGNRSVPVDQRPLFEQEPVRACTDSQGVEHYYIQNAPVYEPAEGESDKQKLWLDGALWERVDELGDATPADRKYTLNFRTGEIGFPEGTTYDTAEMTFRPAGHRGFFDWSRKLKNIDSDIKVCSSFAEEAFLEVAGERAYDCLVAHKYKQPKVYADQPQTQHNATMGNAERMATELGAWRDLIRAHDNWADADQTRRPKVIVTEFGMSALAGAPTAYANSLDAVVQTSTIVQRGIQAGIPVILRHSLQPVSKDCPDQPRPGSQSAFLCDPDHTVTAHGRLYELLNEGLGTRRVASTVSGNPQRNIPDPCQGCAPTYGALRVTSSSTADGTVKLLVTNRDYVWRAASIDLKGRAHAPAIDIAVLRGNDQGQPNYADYNAPGREQVAIQRWRKNVGDGNFEQLFHPNSVTVLTIHPPEAG